MQPLVVLLATNLHTHQYLRRETAVWRTLKHPNILALLGICSGLKYPMSTVPALVSPYCPLGSLGGYLLNNPLVHRLSLVSRILPPPLVYQLSGRHAKLLVRCTIYMRKTLFMVTLNLCVLVGQADDV